MGLIRGQSPILIQLSTGEGLDTPFEDREKLVEVKPRVATFNPCSMSFGAGEFRNPPAGVRRLASRMRELGVKAELDIDDMGHIPVCPSPCVSSRLVRVWQAVVIGRPHLELTAVARALGGSARTGVEDSLYLRRGERAPDNESLVSRLAGAATILEKKIATVKDAEKEFALVGDPR
jgi:uncharacterized protein (DUF849 family)